MANSKLAKIMQPNPQCWTVHSILEEGYGRVTLTDDARACLNVTDFYYLEGPFSSGFAKKLKIPAGSILISSNEDWYTYYLEHDTGAERVKRTMYEWTGNEDALKHSLIIPAGFSVVPISALEAQKIQSLEWCDTVFDSYGSIENFLKQGFGFCIKNGAEIISVCTSFSHSRHGVEIEVDTDPAHRGRGLGRIISAYFIAEGLKRNLPPLWDATNIESAKIATRLGFSLLREYEAITL